MPANGISGALSAAMGGYAPYQQSTPNNATFAQPFQQSQPNNATFQPQQFQQGGVSQATFAPQTFQQSTPNNATFQGAPNAAQPAIDMTAAPSYQPGDYANGQQYSTNANGVSMWQPTGGTRPQGREQGIYTRPDGRRAVTLEGINNLWGDKASSNVAAQMAARRSGDPGAWARTQERLFGGPGGGDTPAPPVNAGTQPSGGFGGSVMDILNGLGGVSGDPQGQIDPLVSALTDSVGQGFRPGDRGYGNDRARPRYAGDSKLSQWGGWG